MKSGHLIHELHFSTRMGWLRAAVLGANDGILSTASLVVGVASANASLHNILLAGTAGLFAGAFSMAAGEYVSVSSQADTEKADLKRERVELENDFEHEREELAQIYVGRGVELALAREVAVQMMAHDALGSHARDELGISEATRPRPFQATIASAASFSLGAMLPLLAACLSPRAQIIPFVFGFSLLSLAVLGVVAARTGGSVLWKGALRVVFWGVLAMAATSVIGSGFSGGT